VVGLFAHAMAASRWRTRIWGRSLLVLFIVAGAVSNFSSGRAETWWNKHFGTNVYDIAREIERHHTPLVIGDDPAHLLSLVHYVRLETRILLFPAFQKQRDLIKITMQCFC